MKEATRLFAAPSKRNEANHFWALCSLCIGLTVLTGMARNPLNTTPSNAPAGPWNFSRYLCLITTSHFGVHIRRFVGQRKGAGYHLQEDFWLKMQP